MFLTFHECDTCEIIEVFVNAEEHEHEHEHKHEQHHASHESCCTGTVCETNTQTHTDCCSDDTYYLKISEPFTVSSLNIKFQEVSFKITYLFSFISDIKNDFIITLNKINRPPDLFGINLLHNICILRI